MNMRKSRLKRIWVFIQNVPLAIVGKKLVSPAKLMEERGFLVKDTSTPEMLFAGAQRQWKRLRDTEFQVKEVEEQLQQMNQTNSRSGIRPV